jgi:hypothetical protein
LSAEKYGDGLDFEPVGRAASNRRAQSSTPTADDQSAPRKRAKIQAQESTERGDDEKKRSRGRPKLDTKDETAADVSVADSTM